MMQSFNISMSVKDDRTREDHQPADNGRSTRNLVVQQKTEQRREERRDKAVVGYLRSLFSFGEGDGPGHISDG